MAMLILFGLLFYSRDRRHWKKSLGYGWIIGLVLMGILMTGGIFGMTHVESTQWSGLPLTLLLAVFGLTAAYPLGVILALGRALENACRQNHVDPLHRTHSRRAPDQPPLHVFHHLSPVPARRRHDQQDSAGTGGHHPFHRRLHRGGGPRRAAGNLQGSI